MLWRTLPHTHCAVTLDIRVSTYTYGACSGTSYVPSNEQQIHDHRNIVDAVALLCNACTPRTYGFSLRRRTYRRRHAADFESDPLLSSIPSQLTAASKSAGSTQNLRSKFESNSRSIARDVSRSLAV